MSLCSSQISSDIYILILLDIHIRQICGLEHNRDNQFDHLHYNPVQSVSCILELHGPHRMAHLHSWHMLKINRKHIKGMISSALGSHKTVNLFFIVASSRILIQVVIVIIIKNIKIITIWTVRSFSLLCWLSTVTPVSPCYSK